jgi:hypothetical protein
VRHATRSANVAGCVARRQPLRACRSPRPGSLPDVSVKELLTHGPDPTESELVSTMQYRQHSTLRTLQYHAVPCSTLLYPTVPCCTLQYPAVPYSTLLYPTVPCCTLQYPAVPYSTLQYPAVPYSTLQYPAVPCSTLLYPTVPCCTLQYPAIPCTVPYVQYLRCPASARSGQGEPVRVLLRLGHAAMGVLLSTAAAARPFRPPARPCRNGSTPEYRRGCTA